MASLKMFVFLFVFVALSATWIHAIPAETSEDSGSPAQSPNESHAVDESLEENDSLSKQYLSCTSYQCNNACRYSGRIGGYCIGIRCNCYGLGKR